MTRPYRQGTVSLDKVRPDPGNVRDDLGDLGGLSASIRANGLLQPLLVRPHGDHFVIVDGHRRYAAARAAGVTEAPVLVTDRTNGRVTAAMLAAAMHKALTPMEQAKAFKALRGQGLGTTQIAAATGYSAGTVRDRLTLLDLPPEAQRMVAAKTLPIGQAVSIAKQVKTRGKGSGKAASSHLPAHFTTAHPLANIARGICTHDGARRIVGLIACGPCWEVAIRADVTGRTLTPVIDEQAIQRAIDGDPAALTLTELDEAVARLLADGLSAPQVATRLRVTLRTVERSRTRQRGATA